MCWIQFQIGSIVTNQAVSALHGLALLRGSCGNGSAIGTLLSAYGVCIKVGNLDGMERFGHG